MAETDAAKPRPVSRTWLVERVRAHDWSAVERGIKAAPELLQWRDERGRGLLHLCCMAPPKSSAEVEASIKTADVLVAAGLDISEAAFTEDDGRWRATPLWHAIGRGRNLTLAEHLLKLGCDPEHSLWAAVFRRDPDAIRLLVRYGANVDADHEEGTPFMGAIQVSHFAEAEVLLGLGANPDVKDKDGATALHLMLKKGSDPQAIAVVIGHGARGDIPDRDGKTVREILSRKRDPALRTLADAFRV
ncbi:MAG TPA: ankyrin repeat domain-containing protein [Caulobacteraceae bacterium]|nr:ankyrin repeat domain-containing protein [Caulobacteraceae bacterium]